MRVTPIPLFCGADSSQNLIQSVTACSQITHSNELAIRGACLQALAVQGALQLPKNGVLDVVGFTDGLISQMREIEGLVGHLSLFHCNLQLSVILIRFFYFIGPRKRSHKLRPPRQRSGDKLRQKVGNCQKFPGRSLPAATGGCG